VPFDMGCTLVDARTLDALRRSHNRVFRALDITHLGYTDPRGLPVLRQTICDYLRAARAVRCEPDQIIVTAGTQQAIDLTIRSLLAPADQVLVEDPCYPLTRAALAASGMDLRYAAVDAQGFCVTAATRAAPQARAVFVTPSHQFPLGVVLTMARRLELLAWARETGAWIIEDDHQSEFRYAGRPLASLQGLDDADRVIYVGTLNKVLFPGLRIGYAVVPPGALPAFVDARHLTDRQPPSLSQAVLAQFMLEGHFAAHIRRTRLLLRDQRDLLIDRLRQRLSADMLFEVPDQGMHFVAYLAEGLSDIVVAQAARRYRVSVRALSPMYRRSPPRSGLLFGFAGHPCRTIAAAVSRLGEAFREVAQSHPRS
jgi:GntR family transcriptional regulator/MocR family aminotransferase